MLWAILVVLVLILIQLTWMGSKLHAIWGIIRAGSDLNLEAHERLLEEMQAQNRIISKVLTGR
jgi:hypothetical protein